MTGLVAIESETLTARINPLGAELWSLTDRQGREYMTGADPAFWSGHAPLLFPIVGALNRGRYRFGGKEYALPKHGFARVSPFELIEHGGERACFRLCDSPATREVYPFSFVLEMAFALNGETLEMTATVRNPGDSPLPFSFGFHPAFAWPLPGRAHKSDHAVVFAEREPQPVCRIDEEGLVARTEATPLDGRRLDLSPALFVDDALIWDELASRTLTYGAPGGGALEIGFPDTSMLGIWQKPGAGYICIEPWAGIADPVGFDGDFHEKPGVMLADPGESRQFRLNVTVKPYA